jgi:hypothetical protein
MRVVPAQERLRRSCAGAVALARTARIVAAGARVQPASPGRSKHPPSQAELIYTYSITYVIVDSSTYVFHYQRIWSTATPGARPSQQGQVVSELVEWLVRTSSTSPWVIRW